MEVPELRNTIYVGEENLDISSGRSVSPTSNSANGSCLLCGFQFTMFKRQHHCRICNILCCDECSKKRCLIENAPVSIIE